MRVEYFPGDMIFVVFDLRMYLVLNTKVCSLRCSRVTDMFLRTTALRQGVSNMLLWENIDKLFKLFSLHETK